MNVPRSAFSRLAAPGRARFAPPRAALRASPAYAPGPGDGEASRVSWCPSFDVTPNPREDEAPSRGPSRLSRARSYAPGPGVAPSPARRSSSARPRSFRPGTSRRSRHPSWIWSSFARRRASRRRRISASSGRSNDALIAAARDAARDVEASSTRAMRSSAAKRASTGSIEIEESTSTADPDADRGADSESRDDEKRDASSRCFAARSVAARRSVLDGSRPPTRGACGFDRRGARVGVTREGFPTRGGGGEERSGGGGGG